MSTPLRHDLTYDAPLAEVAAMLADPAFREAVCDAQHALSRTVTITGTTESGSVAVDYAQAANGVPSFAKKLVGERIEIAQREQWSGNHAALEITIPGKPGEMKGTITLTESGGTTVQRVAADIRVNMPLVGGKAERVIEEILLKALRKENQVGREWLAR
ncbi:DUF2505 domain-containing protein [Nocardioides sp. CER19]|uniref:DUF2505 domain-containing protein n=1 Tax=Nocardioides sp. CER19 TaxID=3038538 RepID=UPI002446920B|nr:DUF2505 domain-containing protein [Nocardioides sp. CER19]MDH2415028.1 DUF2505 domain-containing protein [Nocardioides sp. CER19]